MLQRAKSVIRTSSVFTLVNYAVAFFVVVAFFVATFVFREQWQNTLKNISTHRGSAFSSSSPGHGVPFKDTDEVDDFSYATPLNHSSTSGHKTPVATHSTPFDHAAPLDVTVPGKWPFAYVMFLAEGYDLKNDVQIETSDVYFDSARIITYQLLHAPSTRTNHSIDVVFLVTADVPSWKRERIVKDGARFIEVDKIRIDWLDKQDLGRWTDVVSKIHALELTDYEKICFIDTDMLVRGHLDGLFADPAARLRPTGRNESEIKEDEAPLPESYIFAGSAELATFDHEIPPPLSTVYQLNAGFFVVKPSIVMYEYYLSVLNIPYRFWPSFPEQAMFNYAHRHGGNMPWIRLNWSWNVGFATYKDVQAGGRSFHGKYWMGPDSEYDAELSRLWEYQRAEMFAYWKTLG